MSYICPRGRAPCHSPSTGSYLDVCQHVRACLDKSLGHLIMSQEPRDSWVTHFTSLRGDINTSMCSVDKFNNKMLFSFCASRRNLSHYERSFYTFRLFFFSARGNITRARYQIIFIQCEIFYYIQLKKNTGKINNQNVRERY